MRYLHPVQRHEKFVASGRYRFFKNGQALRKTEAWTIHVHPDGETLIRVDVDSRFEDGKSILVEVLQNTENKPVRFDIHYDSARFEGGIKTLRATYSIAEGRMQVGYAMNGASRDYLEIDMPAFTLIDIPLLVLRGGAIAEMASDGSQAVSLFVPMFEHAQLFPGVVRSVESQVEYVSDDLVSIGRLRIKARRYRYADRAVSYWIDRHGVVIKRVSAFKQQEFVVLISNYAHRSLSKKLQKQQM